MRELSIEEKAKAYDEAIKRVNDLISRCKTNRDRRTMIYRIDDIENIFPELKESEDEKIKKGIIKFLIDVNNGAYTKSELEIASWIAWLEKQGEQKLADNRIIPQKGEYYVCIKDYYPADGKTTNTKGKVYKSPCDGYINDNRGFGLSWINSCTENFFRPVKKEDWIVCEQNNVIGKPLQYKEFIGELIQKNIKSLEDKGIVPNFRLWDIFDAKDGDVLFAKGSYFKEYTFIYSGMTNDNVMSTYCGFDMEHNNFDTKLSRFGRMEDFGAVFPATKEQCDLLFQKMKEAGYEWDANKKELKKIEQKPSNDDAEKEKIDFVSSKFLYCKGSFNEFKEGESYWLEYIGNDNYIGRSDNVLNQKFHITPRLLYTWFVEQHPYECYNEQKPAWSEEDVLEEEIEEWLGCEAFPEGTNITPLPKAMDIVRETANHFYDFGRKQQATRNIQCTNSQVITPESYINEGQKKGIQVVLDNPQEYGLQKPAWSEEDERIIDGLISICDEAQDNIPRLSIRFSHVEALKNWLKSLKDRVQPKQEWKQENTDDLTDFENAMMHIGGSFFGQHAGLDPNDTNAIKEQANLLLELVPKQEWSEEDETGLTNTIIMLKEGARLHFTKKDITKAVDWLKSIKERYTWKPSEELMDALLFAEGFVRGHCAEEIATELASLYEQLKTLLIMEAVVFGIIFIIVGLIFIIALCVFLWTSDNTLISFVICGTLSLAFGICILSVGLVSLTPSAIDVYREKTTLQITYKDSIPIDSIVVFK